MMVVVVACLLWTYDCCESVVVQQHKQLYHCYYIFIIIVSLLLYCFCIFRYVYLSFIMYACDASLVERNLKQNLKVKTWRTSFHFMFFVQVPRSTKIMTYFVPVRGTWKRKTWKKALSRPTLSTALVLVLILVRGGTVAGYNQWRLVPVLCK